MANFNMKFSHFSTILKARSQKVINEIDFLGIEPSSGVENAEKHGRIRLSAAKMDNHLYKSTGDYVSRLNQLFNEAKENNSAMLVLPQLSSLLTLSIPVGGKKILDYITDKNKASREDYFHEYMFSLGQWNYDFYLNTFSRFARQYEMYVQPGSVFVSEGGRIYNRSFIFDNKGNAVYSQDKIFLTEFEKNLGLTPGTDINVAKTPLGNFTVLNDSDCLCYEPAKIAKELGANIIISSCLSKSEYMHRLLAENLRWRCEEQDMYGIMSCFKYDSFKTSVYFTAPVFITENQSGILAQSDKTGTKSYSLNYSKLENIFDPFTSDENPYLYQKYFSEIYK